MCIFEKYDSILYQKRGGVGMFWIKGVLRMVDPIYKFSCQQQQVLLVAIDQSEKRTKSI